jgi:hypothetical protein
VTLSASPAGFGTLESASVVIPRDALRATFHFTASPAAAVGASGTLTARVDTSLSASAAVDIAASVPRLASLTPSADTTVHQDAQQVFTVTLDAPALYDTPVDIFLSAQDGQPLGSAPAQVVVPQGQTSATFTFSPRTTSEADGSVTASLGADSATTTVFVRSPPPRLLSITADTSLIRSGKTANLTVTLDKAAQGDTVVELALSQATGVGSVPATVTIPDGATSAQAVFTADAMPAGTDVSLPVTVSATVDRVRFQSAALTVWRYGLVINEVDYDNVVANDPNEFVEIFNASPMPISLAHVDLVLVNGSDSKEYKRVPLSALGTLGPGEYLVVGSSSVLATLPSGTKSITVSPGSSGFIQNGSPDALGLFDMTDATRPVMLDSLSYEGAVKGYVSGTLTFNLQEGPDSPTSFADKSTGQEGSLSRIANGKDTDVNTADFVFTPTLTPGAANVGP